MALSVISRTRRLRGKLACGRRRDVAGKGAVGELGEGDVDGDREVGGDVFGGGEDGSEEFAGEEAVRPELFGEGDELVGGMSASLGMLPAREDFEAGEQASAEFDERLEIGDDLAVFQGSAQIARVVGSHGRDDTTASRGLPNEISVAPAESQVPGGLGPTGESELKTGGEETAGNDLTALEDELGFGAQEEGADLEHPVCCGKADASAPCFAESAEEVAVGKGMRRGQIDWACEAFGGDDELDGADEVGFVDPGDELISGQGGAAEAVADEREEDVEDSAGVGAEGHGAAESDLASARSRGGEEGFFPGFGDLDGEVPRVGCAGFIAAEFARGLVHGAVERVAIDGCGAGVEPDGRRVIEPGDDFVEDFCGLDAGVEDDAAVGGVVAAVDAAAGEVDADVAVLELGGPWARRSTIPDDAAPWSWARGAGEDGDCRGRLRGSGGPGFDQPGRSLRG